jgi:aminotransferase
VAIHGDVNQYAATWGSAALRNAIADKYRRWYQMEVDPDREMTVTCGATEAMAAVFLALVDPGDEIIVIEPFYETYTAAAVMAGAKPVYVPLDRSAWALNIDRLRGAISPRTRAIVLNTPHNPTGRVFTRDEMAAVAALCVEHDVWVITDAPYEHLVYAGHHHEMATFPGMRDRTVTISSLSKTYSCTGWRIGWAIAPAAQTNAIRKVHDVLTVGAPAPLQAAAAVGFAFDADYYNHFTAEYKVRREFLCAVLREVGFTFDVPQGAYYIFADFSKLSPLDDVAFARWLASEIGVATAPGSSFFANRDAGRTFVRFVFCKKDETLHRAAERLRRLAT